MSGIIRRLYKVTVRASTWGGVCGSHGNAFYVVATDPTTAYSVVRKNLDNRCPGGYGFASDRELKIIELIAEENQYTECGHMLLVDEAQP